MTQKPVESLGENIIQDEGEAFEEQRKKYYGPLFLTSYYVVHGASIFYVDDPEKLPEKAIAVRVQPDQAALASMLSSAMFAGKAVSVVPGHRWHLEGGKIAWTCWRGRIEYQ